MKKMKFLVLTFMSLVAFSLTVTPTYASSSDLYDDVTENPNGGTTIELLENSIYEINIVSKSGAPENDYFGQDLSQDTFYVEIFDYDGLIGDEIGGNSMYWTNTYTNQSWTIETDSLAILKNDRKTIIVEQKFNSNKRGSGHIIKADWIRIIDLYSKYDDLSGGSIRFRKSIRYRIISLMKNIKSFGESLKKLLQKQKQKYLKGLIEFKESEEFNDYKFALFKILKDFKWMAIHSDELNTDNIVPHYDHPNLILEVKNERIYHELTYKNYVKEELNRRFKINTTIKPMF